ncbi:MAG: thioredoxin [Acidobacteriota bacterium]|nr:thioredoxin [Acidobacteriota bacterium]MDQ7087154.1 thioredoxin [Acidobacteriota bacterium]
MANLPALRDDTFDAEVLQSDTPVLVDFSATWCGPCKALAPTVEALAGEYAGKMKFFSLDVDDARATAHRFGVHTVPTLLFFKGGEVVGHLLGNRTKSDLSKFIDEILMG